MDKRIEKTQQALENALFDLCSSKNAEEITISELCKKAGVNRTTFYKYYSVPEDVLRQFQNKLFQTQIEKFFLSSQGNGPRENSFLENNSQGKGNSEKENSLASSRKEIILQNLTDSLWEVRDHKQAYQYYLQKGCIQSDLMEQFIALLGPSLKNTDRCYFLSGGMTALVSKWVKENCPGNPRQLAEKIYWYMEKIR